MNIPCENAAVQPLTCKYMQNTNQKYLGIDDSTIIVNGAKTVNESLIQKVEATLDNEVLRIPQDLKNVEE